MIKSISLFLFFFSLTTIGFTQTVTIGNQVWTTKNLDVSTFRNGDSIPQAKTDSEWEIARENKQAAWCYYDNDSANGAKYGKLYNWYAVNDPRGLAPNGYHIPTDLEWKILTDYLGGDSLAGNEMKSNNGWYENGNGYNPIGFSGLPGGLRGNGGRFGHIGKGGFWLSSLEGYTDKTYCHSLRYVDGEVSGNLFVDKGSGLSVRCLRD